MRIVYGIGVPLLLGGVVIFLTRTGVLKDGLAVSLAWLVLLLVFGAVYVAVTLRASRRARRFIEVNHAVTRKLGYVTNSESEFNIQIRAREELNRIRQSRRGDEFEEILGRTHFRRLLQVWDEPGIVPTFHAVQSISDIAKNISDSDLMAPISDYFLGHGDARRRIEFDHFDDFIELNDGSGCWFATSDKHKKALHPKPSLEAADAALRVAQAMVEKSGRKCDFAHLRELLGGERMDRFVEYLRRRFDPQSGGVIDTDDRLPNVASTGLAIRISNIMLNSEIGGVSPGLERQMPERLGLEMKLRPSDFILRCLSTASLKGMTISAFRENLKSEDLLMCVSYFAAKSLHITGRLPEVMSMELSNNIENFLNACLRRSTGHQASCISFAAGPEASQFSKGDLMHTYYALRLGEMCCPEYLKGRKRSFWDEVIAFLGSCKSGQGYGFRPDMAPNVYTTCLARNTFDLVEKYVEDKPYSFNLKDSLEFFITCYNGKVGAFSGYPYEVPGEERPLQSEPDEEVAPTG